MRIFLYLLKKLNIQYYRFIRTTSAEHRMAVQHLWKKLEDKKIIITNDYQGYYCKSEESFYLPSKIQNDKCPNEHPVYYLSQKLHFLRLSPWEDFITEFINCHIIPSTHGKQLLAFMKEGLQDLCISRLNKKFGITVPNDDNYTIYVWLDALINYITACSYPQLDDKWGNAIHVCGKDIVVFHGIYWPIILKSCQYCTT